MGLCAMGIGMAKTGLGGLGMVVVPVMANIFGAKSSTGILLILLILADFLVFDTITCTQTSDNW